MYPSKGFACSPRRKLKCPLRRRDARLSAELPEAPAEEQLITLEAGGKKYGYYVSGEALLLCPTLLP